MKFICSFLFSIDHLVLLDFLVGLDGLIGLGFTGVIQQSAKCLIVFGGGVDS